MSSFFSDQGIFEGSSDLKEIVQRYNWDLYNIPLLPRNSDSIRLLNRGIDPLWKVLNRLDSAENYLKGNTYTFLPRPGKGQTLEKACEERGFLGPSIELGVEGADNSVIVYVSALTFAKRSLLLNPPPGLFLSSSARINVPDNDSLQEYLQRTVSVEYSKVLETFRKGFRITKFEDLYINVILSSLSKAVN